MQHGRKKTTFVRRVIGSLAMMGFASFVYANDLLGKALEGDVQDSFGNGSMFWKIFILVDIILATAATVKTKNPMVFVGVAAVAFIPAFLIKSLVF